MPVGDDDINSLLETTLVITARDTYRLSRRGWYPVRHIRHKALAFFLKSGLPVLSKEGIGNNHFPLLSLADNLPVANHLISLYGAVTHRLIARAQASIHSPDILPLAIPAPTIRHLGEIAANRAKIYHLCLTIISAGIKERAIANFCGEGEGE